MKHKVLIICGGGIFGEIPAHFLSMVPTEDLKRVDMLAGCSIGGILAAAYASGHSFQEIDKVFQERAKDCFDKRAIAYVSALASPMYKNKSIDAVINEMIGDCTMGDVRKKYPDLDLIIPSLNITEDKYKVWDNITGDDDNVKLADISGFTSAAPTYYAGRDYNGVCMIDGGLIEVAPLITATTALKGKRNVHFSEMDVLMIGTGYDRNRCRLTTKKYNSLNALGVATEVIVPYTTLSNELATRYWGKHIGYNSFKYFNPCVISGEMDDVSLIPEMIEKCDSYKNQFLEVWNKFLE